MPDELVVDVAAPAKPPAAPIAPAGPQPKAGGLEEERTDPLASPSGDVAAPDRLESLLTESALQDDDALPYDDDSLTREYLSSRSTAQNYSTGTSRLDALLGEAPAEPGTGAPKQPGAEAGQPSAEAGATEAALMPANPSEAAALAIVKTQPPTDQYVPDPSQVPIGQRIYMGIPLLMNGGKQQSWIPEKPGEALAQAASNVGAVAGDIAVGVSELPAQIVGGVADAFNNTVALADDIVKYGEEHGLPNAYVRLFDKDGNWSPAIQTEEEFRAAVAAGDDQVFQVPTTDKPETVTATIARAAVPLLLGRAGVLKAGGKVVGKLPLLAREAVADFLSAATVGADPKDKRLSNFLQERFPNIVTDYLQADPKNESALEERFKSGLENAGLGVAVTGAIGVLKAIKSGVKEAAPAGPTTPAAAPGAPAAPVAATEPAAAPAPPGVAVEGTAPAPIADAATGPVAPPAAGEAVATPPPPPTGEIVTPPVGPVAELPPGAVEPPPAAAAEPAPAAAPAAEGAPPAPAVPPKAAEPQAAAPQAAGPRDWLLIGDDLSPHVIVPGGLRKMADDFLLGKPMPDGTPPPNPVKINLARMASGDDIRAAVWQVSETLPKRAVQSNEQTALLANHLNMQPEDLLKGYQGAQLDAVESTAMRMILDSSAEQLVAYAQKGLAQGATELDKAKFYRAFSAHRAIQQYAEGARSEAGRTLQSWNMMVKGSTDQAKAVKQMIEYGGTDVETMMQRIAGLDKLRASQLVADSSRTSARDALVFGIHNILLSNPKTIVKQFVSDTTMALWNTAVRYTASKIGSGAVAQGEAAAYGYGIMSAFPDAIRLGWKAMKTGESRFYREYQKMEGSASARRTLLSRGAEGPLGTGDATRNAAGYLKMLVPTTWQGAYDDFAKYIYYRAELRAVAYRQGVERGLEGQALGQHINDALSSVPRDLHEVAKQAAVRNTFQDPLGAFGGALQKMVDSFNLPIGHGTTLEIPLGRVVMPFVRTPANIMKWVYTNSPAAAVFASSKICAELAAGGATRDLALARMAMGSTVSLGFAGLALSGTITGRGPSDPANNRAWRAAGNEPYSVQVPGHRPVGYNQVDPLGLMAGLIADTYDTMKYAEDPHDTEALAASLAFGVGNALMSKTYLTGVAQVFEAMQTPEESAKAYTARLVSSLIVPAGVNALTTAMDPWVRAHRGTIEAMQARTPWMSSDLPPARTLWGDPIQKRDAWVPGLTGTGFARALSPIPLGAPPENAQPIDKWIWDNRLAFPHGPEGRLDIYKPSRVLTFEKGRASTRLKLDGGAYDRFQVLAGNEVKDPRSGLGAKDYLNALVEGRHPVKAVQSQWDRAPDTQRAVMVKDVINKFRTGAKAMMLEEYPDIKEAVKTGLLNAGARLESGSGTTPPPGPSGAGNVRQPTIQGNP